MPARGATLKFPSQIDLNTIESQIDALYLLPLTEFTAARNALAKTLKGDAASRVKKLEKPGAVAWATNQLFGRDRASYDHLMAAGRSLREAQVAALGGAAADPKRSATEHRAALSAAVTAATRLAAEHDVRPGTDPVSRMLETLSLAPKPPAHAGRFVDLLQPAGFEALAGITTIAASPVAAAPRPELGPRPTVLSAKSLPETDPATEQQKANVVAAARKAADLDVQQATRRLEQARAAEVRLSSQVDAARAHLESIERSHHDAVADVERSADALSRAETRRNRL